MKKLLVIVVVFFISCADINYVERPDDFYGDEKMSDIMVDIYLIDATMTSNRNTFTDLESLPTDLIYKKYDTDSVTFTDNFYYYVDDTERYQKLLERMDAKFSILKDSVDSKQKRAISEKRLNYSKKEDSLANLQDPEDQ